MPVIKNAPVLTDTYDSVGQFCPAEGSMYVCGSTGEKRSLHIDRWREAASGVDLIEIHDETLSSFLVKGEVGPYSLRSERDISRLWQRLPASEVIYIDITGLTHAVWARLIKSALITRRRVLVIYVEPDIYVRSSAPIEGQVYDLSSRIQGVSPLPGYAVLSGRNTASLYVPLLGFEGARLKYVSEQVQPSSDRIIPIVGSPGFKPWYVFETYLGNRAALMEGDSWQAVRYAPANCPFSCFYLLEELAERSSVEALKVALVGTKPHSLGAVLFALDSKKPVELVHDHPIRKSTRTDGIARLHVYHISAIFEPDSPLFEAAVHTRMRRRADRN